MDLRDLQKNWNRLGATDPLWAVATAPQYKNNAWDPAEFFATGAAEISRVLAEADQLVPTLARTSALDFGCGVGRLSQALAANFDSVVGIDIAPAMLEKAREWNTAGPKVEYLLNEVDDLSLLRDRRFDFIYSSITLMHMEPRFGLRYVGEFIRRLAPGGLLVFQLPEPTPRQRLREALPRPVVTAVNRLRTLREPMMEIYGVPKPQVEAVVRDAGGRLLKAEARGALHGAPQDYLYWVTTS